MIENRHIDLYFELPQYLYRMELSILIDILSFKVMPKQENPPEKLISRCLLC